MRKITHLNSDFTHENTRLDIAGSHLTPSWQVRHLARQHHLPENRALLIAELFGLPAREAK